MHTSTHHYKKTLELLTNIIKSTQKQTRLKLYYSTIEPLPTLPTATFATKKPFSNMRQLTAFVDVLITLKSTTRAVNNDKHRLIECELMCFLYFLNDRSTVIEKSVIRRRRNRMLPFDCGVYSIKILFFGLFKQRERMTYDHLSVRQLDYAMMIIEFVLTVKLKHLIQLFWKK